MERLPNVGERVKVRMATRDGVKEVVGVAVMERPSWRRDSPVPPCLMAKYRLHDGTTDTVGIVPERVVEIEPGPELRHFPVRNLLPGDKVCAGGEWKTVASVGPTLTGRGVKLRFDGSRWSERHPRDEVVPVRV